MTTFLGGDYVRKSRLGGCGVIEHRTRYAATNLAQKNVPAEEAPQRFDFALVVRGDLAFRRRFWAHRRLFGVTGQFRVPVPQFPDVAAPPGDDAHCKLAADAAAGAKAITVVNTAPAAWTAAQSMFFTAAGGERVYQTTGEDAAVGAGNVALAVAPALTRAIARNTLLDFAPTPLVTYLPEAGFSEISFDDDDEYLVRFVVANSL